MRRLVFHLVMLSVVILVTDDSARPAMAPGDRFSELPTGLPAHLSADLTLRPLTFVTPEMPLSSGYRLPIQPVPEVPEWAQTEFAIRADDSECFLDVRAIVLAENVQDSFAVVVFDDVRRTVRVGDRFRARGRRVAVTALQNDAVMIRADTDDMRCSLW